jgi:hypothetical protein
MNVQPSLNHRQLAAGYAPFTSPLLSELCLRKFGQICAILCTKRFFFAPKSTRFDPKMPGASALASAGEMNEIKKWTDLELKAALNSFRISKTTSKSTSIFCDFC